MAASIFITKARLPSEAGSAELIHPSTIKWLWPLQVRVRAGAWVWVWAKLKQITPANLTRPLRVRNANESESELGLRPKCRFQRHDIGWQGGSILVSCMCAACNMSSHSRLGGCSLATPSKTDDVVRQPLELEPPQPPLVQAP